MTMIFDQKGDFQAIYAAEKYCNENGISYGSMCSPYPIGLIYGEVVIAKWRNLTKKERDLVDGTITGDFRNGPLTLTIRDRDGF